MSRLTGLQHFETELVLHRTYDDAGGMKTECKVLR